MWSNSHGRLYNNIISYQSFPHDIEQLLVHIIFITSLFWIDESLTFA